MMNLVCVSYICNIRTSLKTMFLVSVFLLSCVFTPAFSATPLDVNTATAEQFAAVMTGVGRKKAQAIVEYRNENGAFTEVDELIFVKGIGPSLLKKNRDYLSIGPGEEYKEEKLADLPL
ncbi:ComEA family DNA-binding protein [Marinomonas sp. S3726]|uniref:ComEA family DNA-binding protein n=1 Tax=Marinomonas sp. S3726 TaxID=579484 RepID=UPI001EE1B78A|nr:ComEA family DNA-binding protein [Marinomonas sp. S3726]